MAAEQVEFELVSPEKLLLSEKVEMVVVPGAEGDFGVLPRHAPLISSLRTGVISVYRQNRRDISERIFVDGGFAEVTPERCTVLAEQAVPVGEIDRSATEQQLKDAREDLSDAASDAERQALERRITRYEGMLQAFDSA
ncbi:F0F1 ATP synthase subunit epsilon [Algihabitans albus]|uniref:F0F1 ATP synthase subunit epsilon n=1 Tax=Algihabitans albus TaxID=2164067 RepID=UPI000E5D4ECD|nr:F0F1 ATP synthase subunit epsilon [Algihabitans albus]